MRDRERGREEDRGAAGCCTEPHLCLVVLMSLDGGAGDKSHETQPASHHATPSLAAMRRCARLHTKAS